MSEFNGGEYARQTRFPETAVRHVWERAGNWDVWLAPLGLAVAGLLLIARGVLAVGRGSARR